MRVLMVSTEYPPMVGGVGRYTFNLTEALKKRDQDVFVLSNEKGDGDYKGISPHNKNNSSIILEIVKDAKPDIVHIQFEPGLYGLYLDNFNSGGYKTHIDRFYEECKIPIITTFHSVYSFRDWIGQIPLVKRTGRTGKLGIPARFIVKLIKNILFYNSFMVLNKKKLKQSFAGIVFSNYASRLLGGKLNVIYHGAEPATFSIPIDKAREYFSIPIEKKIGATIGFRTITKGWDILDGLQLSDNWAIVSNSSKNNYSEEEIKKFESKNEKIIDLQLGYLNDRELSLLLTSCDAMFLPYRITSGSGVMFDALAHGLPFVASNLGFFKEFADMGLGITAKRNKKDFSKAVYTLEKNYDIYYSKVEEFRKILKWDNISKQHIELYERAKMIQQ